MIDRYTLKEMGKLWSIENEWQTVLEVELAVCDAMAEIGEIPISIAKDIRSKAKFNITRIQEIESVTHHDIISFLTCVAEYVGENSKYIHRGLTSSDVKDTAICLMLKRSAEIIINNLKDFRAILRRRAKEFKYTPCIGRTHGIHAEPMTFGLKFLLWSAEVERNIDRIEHAKNTISVGKLSGAVGNYSNINPKIEELVCNKLGLIPVRLATQVIQRDRHAEYLTALAIVSSTLEKISTEIRNLQRTDIHEVEEYFSAGQKGSSAMPHKRNPINCERITGMARLVRGNAIAALENITLWHERDISHSSAERVIFPDSTINVDYCIKKITEIIDNLLVYPEVMLRNMNRTGGLIYSQRILLEIVNKGILREEAYKWVQRNAMKYWSDGESFYENISKDPDITKYLTQTEIEKCFDWKFFLRNIDLIFSRFKL